MKINIDTNSRSFRYSFVLSTLILSFLFFGLVGYSWTGPTGTAPNSNVSAPINVGATSQVKSGALSVNGLSIYGDQYLTGNLGIGISPQTTWSIYATSNQYGIYGTATNGQAIRGATTAGGYAGYFVGGGTNAGGVYAANSSGYYAYLGYPGSSYGVYTNGNMYAADYYSVSNGHWINGYGGWYVLLNGSSCRDANPHTGACSCPSGYSANVLTSNFKSFTDGYWFIMVQCW